jgi:hypothetical protein
MNLKKVTQKNADGSSISYEFDVPKMQDIPDHPGDPKGTDTVPAWLTPGEFVMNAEATRMFEPQIEAMNNAGRAVQKAQGGSIPEYKADGGEIPNTQSAGDVPLELSGVNPAELLSQQQAERKRELESILGTPDIPDSLPLIPERDPKLQAKLDAVNPNLKPIAETPSQEGLDVPQLEPGDFFIPKDITNDEGKDLIKKAEADYVNGDISKEELTRVKDEVFADVSNTASRGRAIAEGERDKLLEKRQRAIDVGQDTSAIDAEIAALDKASKAPRPDILSREDAPPLLKIQAAVAATEGEPNPGNDNKTSKEVETAGSDVKDTDPTMWEKAKGFIYDAFDEVLDTKGLTQAALLYLGSRALGYSHGGSLNYVGKAYAQQIGNKLKAADKASLSNKFTKESVEKYRKTGNVSDLKATSSWSDDKTNIYVNNAGKTFNVVSQKSADGKIRHIDVDTGKPIDIRKLELNEDRTARVANNSKRSAGIADAEYRARIPKDDQDSIRSRLPTPEAIGNATSTKFIEMGLNPAQANKIIADITREMIKDVSVNDKLELTEASLIPYVNKRILTMSLEQQGLAKEFDGVTPEAVATTLGLNINQEDPVAVQKEIKDLAMLWKSLNAKGKEYYNNRRTEGMPPILVLLDEVNKGKANKDLFKVK